MDFELSEEQTLLRNLIERFVKDRYDTGKRAAYLRHESGFDPEGWQMLAEMGVLALPFAADHGGMDGGPVEIMVMMQALGEGVAVEPVLAGPVLAGGLLARAGSEDQIAQWLPAIIDGSQHVALAHIERDARHDLAHVGTTARPRGDDMLLAGQKSFVLGSGGADAFIVSARDKQAKLGDKAAIRFYWVAADAPGLTIQPYRLTDGSVACALRLSDVPAAPLPGGWDAFEDTLDIARLAISAEMVGLMDMLFAQTLDYIRSRKQFGMAIGQFQAIQHRAVELYVKLELSRSHLYRAASLNGEADATARQARIGAKSFIAEAAVQLAEECVQFHGAMGVTDELIIGHAYKRLLLLAALFGPPERELAAYAAQPAC
ncbi:MAG: pimeloyl-CoA dehydrogenase small subunit [Sphingomonadales bacterium]